MSFKPLFENERVRVIRGRMDVGAQEGGKRWVSR
jgi:hypothetical protein